MQRLTELHAHLQAMGASGLVHLSGTLEQHLRGTESLLREWDSREALCIAGLFHAVYGNEAYGQVLASIDQRERIAAVIGSDAEELAYLYGACNRQTFYARLGTRLQLVFSDRFSNTEYQITESALAGLCEITLANELEIQKSRPQFRSRHRRGGLDPFERMAGLVSAAAFSAFRARANIVMERRIP
ncbi:MAG: hypothetical protein Q8N51_01840 [Gammaproteobacteria bacterium]|nr:hypothetical protein [Gammaproteobacteria bacterium]